MTQTNTPPPLRTAILRTGFRVVLILAIAFGAHFLMQWVELQSESLPPGAQDVVLRGFLTVMVLAYAVLIAIPFVPGIEIGISLMMMRGAEVAPVVYLATVAGLLVAFLAGQFLRHNWLRRALLDLRLRRAAEFLDRIQELPRPERLSLLRASLPPRLGRLAIDFRYISVALLVNLPGNALIGGGGGICLIAGLSRLFSTWIFALTIALAVAPVPALVWIFGIKILGN